MSLLDLFVLFKLFYGSGTLIQIYELLVKSVNLFDRNVYRLLLLLFD